MNQNIFERDPVISAAGTYFSIFEWMSEYYGYYGTDIRLHLFFANKFEEWSNSLIALSPDPFFMPLIYFL